MIATINATKKVKVSLIIKTAQFFPDTQSSRKMKTLLVLLLARACVSQNYNPGSGRGMMDDLERMWDGVHSGIDQLQADSRVHFRWVGSMGLVQQGVEGGVCGIDAG